jgi:hypothetical protein
LLVLAVVFVIGTTLSYAALISESFDYAPGSIVGQNGGQGWGSSWSFVYTAGTEEVVSNSLTFSDYDTYGGALKIADNVAGWSSVGVRRNLGYDFAVGDDVWVSFLAKSAEPLTSFTSRTAELRHGPTAGTTEFRMRPKGSSSQGVMIAYDSSSSNSAAKSAQDGRTYLYICRFGDVGEDSGKFAVMWVLDEPAYDIVNADGVITEAELNNNFYLLAQDTHANRMLDSSDGALFNLGDSASEYFAYYFDELRYGTSLDSVLVPEPTTFILLGFGAFTLISRKKK